MKRRNFECTNCQHGLFDERFIYSQSVIRLFDSESTESTPTWVWKVESEDERMEDKQDDESKTNLSSTISSCWVLFVSQFIAVRHHTCQRSHGCQIA